MQVRGLKSCVSQTMAYFEGPQSIGADLKNGKVCNSGLVQTYDFMNFCCTCESMKFYLFFNTAV